MPARQGPQAVIHADPGDPPVRCELGDDRDGKLGVRAGQLDRDLLDGPRSALGPRDWVNAALLSDPLLHVSDIRTKRILAVDASVARIIDERNRPKRRAQFVRAPVRNALEKPEATLIQGWRERAPGRARIPETTASIQSRTPRGGSAHGAGVVGAAAMSSRPSPSLVLIPAITKERAHVRTARQRPYRHQAPRSGP